MNTVQPIRNKRDIERMKKALGKERDRLLFIFGINSSLRISDMLKLKVGDVRGKKTLTMTENKTGKTKRFPLNNAVTTAINELVPVDASESDWLFPSRKGGQPISRVQAWRILNAAAERVGLEAVSPHTLRKTMAYHAYKSGVDISLIMSILNHSSQRETLRYIGITQENVDNVYEATCL